MDLTIPYTFYPRVLPHWMSWLFFSVALAAGVVMGVRFGRKHGWLRGASVGLAAATFMLFVTVFASMIVTFLRYDR